MNTCSDSAPESPADPAQAGIPFDWQSMAEVRIRPAAFARLMRVGRSTVSGWIKRGWVRLYPDGRLCPKEAAAALLKHADPGRVRSGVLKDAAAVGDALRRQVSDLAARLREAEADREAAPTAAAMGDHAAAYAEARARREKAAADRAELELARLSGEVLPVASVAAAVADVGTRLRADLESMPDRMAVRGAGKGEAELRALLAAEVNRALSELARGFAEVGGAAPESRPIGQ